MCNLKCRGEGDSICGGMANAASVYTMVDCAKKSKLKSKAVEVGRMAQIKDSYSSFQGEACTKSEQTDLVKLEGLAPGSTLSKLGLGKSSIMIGRLEDCQAACWDASGADTCIGFTFDKAQSKC